MKKLLLIISAIVLFGYSVTAQNTGFLGKRVLLKTDAINGLQIGFNNLDVEVTVGRRFSVIASFRHIYFEDYFGGYELLTGEFQEDPSNRNWKVYNEYRTLKNGVTQGFMGSLSGRFYFNKIVPAPLGFYTEFGIGYGVASYTDYTISFRYKNTDPLEPFNYSRGDIKGLSGESSMIYFEIPSVGYQFALLKFLTFDVKCSFQGYYCDLPSNLLNAMENNIYMRPNMAGFGAGNLAMGFALYGKLGFSLF